MTTIKESPLYDISLREDDDGMYSVVKNGKEVARLNTLAAAIGAYYLILSEMSWEERLTDAR